MDRILVAVAIGLLAAAAHKEGPIELRPVFRENKAGAVIGGRVPLSSHQKVGTIAPAYHYGKYEPNCESGFQYFGDPYANASTMGNIVLSSETINPGMSGYQGVCVVMIYDMNSNENRKGFQIDWTSDCSISVVVMQSTADANVYTYTSNTTANPNSFTVVRDTGLTTPLGHQISSISFCFVTEESAPRMKTGNSKVNVSTQTSVKDCDNYLRFNDDPTKYVSSKGDLLITHLNGIGYTGPCVVQLSMIVHGPPFIFSWTSTCLMSKVVVASSSSSNVYDYKDARTYAVLDEWLESSKDDEPVSYLDFCFLTQPFSTPEPTVSTTPEPTATSPSPTSYPTVPGNGFHSPGKFMKTIGMQFCGSTAHCTTAGDPHLADFCGRPYDFAPGGEFLLTEWTEMDTSYKITACFDSFTAPWNQQNVAVTNQAAFQCGDYVAYVHADHPEKVKFFKTDISGYSQINKATSAYYTESDTNFVIRHLPSRHTITIECASPKGFFGPTVGPGHTLEVRFLTTVHGNNIINLDVYLDANAVWNKVKKGLCQGFPCLDQHDNFYGRDGSYTPFPLNDRIMFLNRAPIQAAFETSPSGPNTWQEDSLISSIGTALGNTKLCPTNLVSFQEKFLENLRVNCSRTYADIMNIMRLCRHSCSVPRDLKRVYQCEAVIAARCHHPQKILVNLAQKYCTIVKARETLGAPKPLAQSPKPSTTLTAVPAGASPPLPPGPSSRRVMQ